MTRIKLDENLSRHLKSALAALGMDVLTVAEENLLSRPDSIIAAAARGEDRILLTLDLEFADLRKHPPGNHPGIVLFKPRSLGPLTVNAFVMEFARSAEWSKIRGCVVVVDPGRVRVRRPPSGE